MTYVSGPYNSGQLLRSIHEVEMGLTERVLREGPEIGDSGERKSWRDRVLEASQGRNTVLYDDKNYPSIMVEFPFITRDGAISGMGSDAHPAFIVDGSLKSIIYVSKYINVVEGSGVDARAMSLRYKDPTASINFDNSLAACQQKGEGWHLNTNATWAAIALQAWKKGFLCRGNNNYGSDHTASHETAIASRPDVTSIARTLTGSGPPSWSHDGTPFGVYDLNGNVREWVGGLRLNEGEINIIPDNDAALYDADHGASSTLWKAMLEDGTFVDPGETNTLKIDCEEPGGSGDLFIKTGSGTNLDAGTSANTMFADLTSAASVPDIIKLLALFPDDATIPTGRVYARSGERLAFRGGHWTNGSIAGLFCLYLSSTRSDTSSHLGFRSAFVL